MTKTSSSSLTTTLSNPNRWKALSILSPAQFLIILYTSIIGVALPNIQQHFNISQSEYLFPQLNIKVLDEKCRGLVIFGITFIEKQKGVW